MGRGWLLLLAAFPVVAACAMGAGPNGAAREPAPAFYVMRHLHTPPGQADPDLLPEGYAAAQRLPALLERHPPAAIYVSNFKRTRQTAAAAAARYRLTPIVYDPADTPGLVTRIQTGPKPALVVGHSNTVPDIVSGLGGTRPGPLTHPDFGDLWRIEANGATTRLKL